MLFTTSEPSPHGIALDNKGNVYITGYVWDRQTENDYI
ncbi:MAG: SBBP repeat-containing protein, partial [bacterium]